MSSTANKVLVAEDHDGVRALLVDILTDAGYDVQSVADGSLALVAAATFRPDLVLLDTGLPGADGWSVARTLRRSSDVPIIFVTGSDSPEDIRAGFDLGGDDYVVKPFDEQELLSRVRAVLRRTGHSVPTVWEIDDLVVNGGGRTVTRHGVPLQLTTLEFDLLVELLRNRGRVVSKPQLLARVWGYPATDHDGHLVEVHVSSLRAKLEAEGARLVHTMRGAGYVLRSPE